MQFHRFLACFAALIALAAALILYAEFVYLLGFPDGFITELGYAQRNLAYLFIGVSIAFSAYCFYLGAIALRQRIRKKLSLAVFLYLGCAAGISIVNYYLGLSLNNGSGG